MGASGGTMPVAGRGRPSRAHLRGGGGLMSASSHLDPGAFAALSSSAMPVNSAGLKVGADARPGSVISQASC